MATGRGRNVHDLSEEMLAFWAERHLCTLTTIRADGTPHVVPVGATLDPDAGLARVITDGGSHKASLVRNGPTRVALCQVDGRRWATVEGVARLVDDPASVADAETRYALRYRPPRPNPDRVVLEITVTAMLGNL